ncbi:hypothetical protein GF352_03440 [archaeon]|nr:hypothetical protein [archaeon]
MLGKEFETHWVRCKKCGAGKPKEAFKGAINRICIECRKKKGKSVIHK